MNAPHPSNDALVTIGRGLYALALVAFGVQQFLFGDFVPGRAPPWPASLPGRLPWAYGSGALLIVAGASTLRAASAPASRVVARRAAVAVGAAIAVWAFARQAPLALADPSFGSAWTKLGKALALSGGTFAVAGSLADEIGSDGRPGGLRVRRSLTHLGRVCLGVFLINSGAQHFLWVEFVTTLVPSWVPGALFWTYFAAVALMAGGAGLIFPPTARAAGTLSGLMVFVWLLILHVPRAVAAPPSQLRNEWTSAFEALAVSGLALLLAAPAGGGRGPGGARGPRTEGGPTA